MSHTKDESVGQAEPEKPERKLFEVLTRTATGGRTVHRFYAADQAAAVAEVEKALAPGVEVIGSAPAGQGLGSGDSE